MIKPWFNSAFVSSESSGRGSFYSCLVDSLWIPSQKMDSLHYICMIPSQKSVFLHTNFVPSFWPGLSEKLLFRNLFQTLLFCTFQLLADPEFYAFSLEGYSIGNSMIWSDIWHKYHEWYYEIVIHNFTSRYASEIWSNFGISRVVFMSNITYKSCYY